MQTLPMPLDAMEHSSGGLSEFLVSSPVEIAALLRQCVEGDVVLSLSSPGGATYSTTIWALDEARGHLSLTAEPNDVVLQSLMEDGEVVAVGEQTRREHTADEAACTGDQYFHVRACGCNFEAGKRAGRDWNRSSPRSRQDPDQA